MVCMCRSHPEHSVVGTLSIKNMLKTERSVSTKAMLAANVCGQNDWFVPHNCVHMKSGSPRQKEGHRTGPIGIGRPCFLRHVACGGRQKPSQCTWGCVSAESARVAPA